MVGQPCHRLPHLCPIANSFNTIPLAWCSLCTEDSKGFCQIFTSNDFPQTWHTNNSFIVLPPALLPNKSFNFLTPPWNQFLEDSIASVAYHTIIYSLLINMVVQHNLKKTIYVDVDAGNAHCLLTVPVGVQSHGLAQLNWIPSKNPNNCLEHTKKMSVGNNMQAAACTTMYRFILDKGKWIFTYIKRSSYSLWTSGSLKCVSLMKSINVNSITIDILHICWSIHSA